MRYTKTTSAIIIATGMGFTAMAQKINSKQVPAAVKATFAKTYPAVKTIKWEKENGDFEAGFKQGNNEMSAVFKADGSQTESELEISVTSLPDLILAYVKQHYKGATIKEAAKITKTDTREVNYEAEVNGKDLLFDHTGKFIKIAKD